MPKRASGKLRIVGGEWRSRIVEFDPQAGVRPTPDRVRETLFNWLAPVIEDARCLDLFAGSGALGLEALSRGASKVVFAENGMHQVAMLRLALEKLGAGSRAEVMPTDGLTYLELTPDRFDVVFIDPPFASALLAKTLERLPGKLGPANRIYLEWSSKEKLNLPAGFKLLHEKQAGQVSYGLANYSGAGR